MIDPIFELYQLRQFLILKLVAVFFTFIKFIKLLVSASSRNQYCQTKNNSLQNSLLTISKEKQMIDALFTKEKRVYNNGDRHPKSNNTSFVLTQKLINSQQNHHYPQGEKKTLILTEAPFLSFTSFQSYLQDCNQNAFVKKQNDRLFRSQNKQKTQQNFNPKRQIPHTSQAKNKKFITYQDQLQISPFQTDKQIIFSQYNKKSGKSNRNQHSKSQACDYQFGKSSSFAQRFLHEKLGSLEGWSNHDDEQAMNGKMKSPILREKPQENNKLKTEMYKKRSATIEKEDDLQQSAKNLIVQRHNQTIYKKIKRKPSSNKNNKENVAQSSLTSFPNTTTKKSQKGQMENQFIHFAKNHLKRSINTANCLTQINELQQQILLSKRDDNMTNRSGNNQLKSNIKREGDSNIMRLKREAQYLCRNQQETAIHRGSLVNNDDKQNFHSKHTSLSILLTNNNGTNYANPKAFKPFSKFNATDQPGRYNHVNKSNDSLHSTINCSFQLQQQSPRMMKILQSISPIQEALIFKAQTPVKTTENLKNNGKMVGTQSDMKHATRNRQKFHQSMKQRKSKSAFNSICKAEKPFLSKQTPKISTSQFSNTKTDEQNKFLITIVNSFNSAKNTKAPTQYNKNNLSMTKSIHSTVNNKEFSQWRRLHTSESYQNENDSLNMTTNSKVISEFMVESSHQGQLPFQQIGSIQFGMESKLQNETQMMDDTMQPFDKLNKLSQDIKKNSKISTPASLSTKYNKKLINFKKSIKNAKPSLLTSTVIKTDKPIQNLCISQLEGRKIHKLRKITQINS